MVVGVVDSGERESRHAISGRRQAQDIGVGMKLECKTYAKRTKLIYLDM